MINLKETEERILEFFNIKENDLRVKVNNYDYKNNIHFTILKDSWIHLFKLEIQKANNIIIEVNFKTYSIDDIHNTLDENMKSRRGELNKNDKFASSFLGLKWIDG